MGSSEGQFDQISEVKKAYFEIVLDVLSSFLGFP